MELAALRYPDKNTGFATIALYATLEEENAKNTIDTVINSHSHVATPAAYAAGRLDEFVLTLNGMQAVDGTVSGNTCLYGGASKTSLDAHITGCKTMTKEAPKPGNLSFASKLAATQAKLTTADAETGKSCAFTGDHNNKYVTGANPHTAIKHGLGLYTSQAGDLGTANNWGEKIEDLEIVKGISEELRQLDGLDASGPLPKFETAGEVAALIKTKSAPTNLAKALQKMTGEKQPKTGAELTQQIKEVFGTDVDEPDPAYFKDLGSAEVAMKGRSGELQTLTARTVDIEAAISQALSHLSTNIETAAKSKAQVCAGLGSTQPEDVCNKITNTDPKSCNATENYHFVESNDKVKNAH
ncbi:Trypanosome variant surface glycoprotein (A-type), putative [Trypanosoma equiperdum]|uniref:Trypanosome variant surface glycoprotein (A-type), putative n=1 Tax=Trypanosoma equiperdum TaxID=5694 RepID=A0A1G4IFG9_TRYEQ|nr:Trypanosome variant surface glycoprotein (A-type), putative [Trypanosoma equiperdum]